jgi:hypothetical protein
MPSEDESIQDREWQLLHDRITETLDHFGRKDAFGDGDYWLVDDNWGWRQQKLEIQNLALFEPRIIKMLQALLADFPKWRIAMQVAVVGREKTWPGMGIFIYNDQIADELQRDYLPVEFRKFIY